MNYRGLGRSGIKASVVGLGTWAIGGWMWGGADQKQAERAIHAAIDQGINLIDTAPIYGFGRSEEIVGQAIQKRRHLVVLATKCGLAWEGEAGEYHFTSDEDGMNPDGELRVHKYLAPAAIRKEIEASLRRLKTDYIDLYQTHWQDATTPITDTMEELIKLKQEGKIRAIGVCNASSQQMQTYAERGRLDSDQEKFSMLDRDIETDQLPYCREQEMAVLAYSPLALGLLTGKIQPDRTFGKGDLRASNPRFTPEGLGKVRGLLDGLKEVAAAKTISVSQLVIAWTVAQPGLSHALVGARRQEQAVENAQAGAVALTEEELEAINVLLEKNSVAQ